MNLQITLENHELKQQHEFDFISLFLESLQRHFEGAVSYKVVRSFCACRFSFTKQETRAALRAAAKRFPDCVILKNKTVVFSKKNEGVRA